MKVASDYVRQMDSLDGERSIEIKAGFLSHVLNVYKTYFELINSSISNKENS
tara:strand:- start:9780 stop:9935 length:156 start_codon:yes stop_codon:yes gene_type:complete